MNFESITGFINRKLKNRQAAKGLQLVPRITCGAECLMPAEEVRPAKVFSSELITSEWEALAPQLQRLGVPDGAGGVNPGDGRAIFYLVRYFKPRSVLEVGTHIGASTIHIAAALRGLQSSAEKEPTELVSVDVKRVNDPISKPWLQRGGKYSPAEMIDRLGCGGLVEFVTASSLDYLRQCGRKFDFIFLDGDHAAETVYQEIPAALGLLESDGLILLHDYFPGLKPLWPNKRVIPGPFLATERLKAEGVRLQVLPLSRLPWPTKLKSNTTSLALLVRSAA